MLKSRTAKNYKPPFGYDVTEEGNLIPLEDDLGLLQEIAELIEQRALSIRDGAIWLSAKSSRTISHEGLRKRLMQAVRIDGV
jgi:hypothetical protein